MAVLTDLITRLKEKDIKAFEELHFKYSESINGIVYSIVKNENIAEEITQDVFLKVWDKPESYCSKKGRFFTWVLNIAKRKAIDSLRSKNYKQSKLKSKKIPVENIAKSNNALDNFTNTIGLNKLVSKLDQKSIRILNLIYFEGYTQKETSEELQIPLGTVKTKSRNSLRTLRTMML